MAGRIRSIKPEWLDDEKMLSASVEARLLSVSLLLLADDHGRGRAHKAYIGSQVFPSSEDSLGTAERALGELVSIGYVTLYEVRSQSYFEIRNWKKHQRVDKPGSPRVPSPEESTRVEETRAPVKVAYFIRGMTTGLIKIGESVNPVARLSELVRQASEGFALLAIGENERALHVEFAAHRVHGEWFKPHPDIMERIAKLGGCPDNPIATVEYHGERVVVANHSGTNRESFAPDLRPRPRPRPTTTSADLAPARVGDFDFAQFWSERTGIVMPDGQTLLQARDHLGRYASAKGLTLQEATQSALDVFAKLSASWSAPQALTPALLLKKWDAIQAGMSGAIPKAQGQPNGKNGVIQPNTVPVGGTAIPEGKGGRVKLV